MSTITAEFFNAIQFQQQRGCHRKVAYSCEGRAVEAAKVMRLRHPEDELQPYYCRFCGRWHLGHPSATVKV